MDGVAGNEFVHLTTVTYLVPGYNSKQQVTVTAMWGQVHIIILFVAFLY